MLHQPSVEPLADAPVDQPRYVARIEDDDPALLRWLADTGITVDAEVVVRERKPFGGATLLDVALPGDPPKGRHVAELGNQAVAALLVSVERASPKPLNDQGCHYSVCRHIGSARVPEKNR